MDSPYAEDMAEQASPKFSPKLSRRKRSRPVKFSQDFVLTDLMSDEHSLSDEYVQSATDVSSATCSSPRNGVDSYEGSPLSIDVREEFCDQDDVSQASSADMIQRTIPSIRESSHLKVGNPKRIKLEDNKSPVPEESSSGQIETETTFSSLLHTFASHVTRTVDPNDRQSPYKEQAPASDSIWPMQRGKSPIPTKGSKSQGTTPVQSEQCTATSANAPNEVSFSGLLQNFVSCVNDSSPKGASANPPAPPPPRALNQNSRNRTKSIPFTVGTECQSRSSHPVTNTQSAYGKNQQSFAGLLYSFASVVDKEGQSSQETSQPVRANFLPVNSSEGCPQKAPKSLLDVLHDTISRRVMESACSPPRNPSSCNQLTSDLQDQLSDQFSAVNGAPCKEAVGDCNVGESLPHYQTPSQDNARGSDTLFDLHPSGQQWSHIRNVLPPLDAEEDDTSIREQTYEPLASQSDGNSSKRFEDNLNHSPVLSTRQVAIKTEPVDEGVEAGQSFTGQDSQIRVKEEPMEYPSTSTWDPSGLNVNSTLRERLLSRIESRQSPQAKSPSYPSTAGELSGNDCAKDMQRDDMPPSGKTTQEQAGLVSQLLTSGESLQWRERCGSSFADLLHDITSSMLEKEEPPEKTQRPDLERVVIKEEPHSNGNEQERQPAEDHSSSISDNSSQTVNKPPHKREESSPGKSLPRCIARLLSGTSDSNTIKEGQASETRKGRVRNLKVMSYADHPSTPSSSCTSSEEVDQSSATIQSRSRGKQLHNLSPRARHTGFKKQRWKRGTKYGLKLKQGWPKRRESIDHSRNEIMNLQEGQQGYNSKDISSTIQDQHVESDTSFTGLLQKLAQKCQAGSVQTLNTQIPAKTSLSAVASLTPQQSELFVTRRQPEQFQPGKVSAHSSRSSVRELLMKQRSQVEYSHGTDTTLDNPSTSIPLSGVSFSNLMQDMATTVKKKGVASPTPFEDLTSIDPPSPWLKSTSGNWLRFLFISDDENPSVTISVAINLWQNIHEVKIHCHHMEVPVNHWIFRRFGKRIHTKAALRGILQAISNGCSVCEGTTRSDLVQMYRNKLASTSRWQAAAVLEDSFGAATVRSKQCELLVSGLRRSREKRCSKCSTYVDRKLKAVMYHMRKKLGLS